MHEVQFQSDGRTLEGWFARPPGSKKFPAVLWNHGSDNDVIFPTALQKFYTDHGFAFFAPVRRYHRPSLKSGNTINERVSSAECRETAWVAFNEEENRDVMNALAWLKQHSSVNTKRIVVSGVSYGGVQTLLAAEQGGFDAAIAFAPAAMSWGDGDTEINERMKVAVMKRKTPMFILQAENDYNLGPTQVLGGLLMMTSSVLDVLGVPNLPVPLAKAKIYPPYGTFTPEMALNIDEWHKWGHGRFATLGFDVWGPDVLAFIDKAFAA